MPTRNEKAGGNEMETTADGGARKPLGIEADAGTTRQPSWFSGRRRIFGAVVILVIASLALSLGTYQFWRGSAQQALEIVGIDLPAIEADIGVPHWLSGTRSDTVATQGAAPAISPPALQSPKTQTAPVMPTPGPPAVATTSTSFDAIAALQGRVDELENNLAQLADRLAADEATTERLTALSQQERRSAPSVSAFAATLQDLADRVLVLEARPEAARDTADPGRGTGRENAGVITTLVGLAERLVALEARAAVDPTIVMGLRQELGILGERITALDLEIEKLAGKVVKPTPERDRAALILLGVNQLTVATAGQGSYGAELDALRPMAPTDSAWTAAIAALEAHAETGVSSLARLERMFRPMARAVIQSRDAPTGEDPISRALSEATQLFTIRKVNPQETGTVDGAIAAAEKALDARDLRAAVAALGSLDGPPGQAVLPWLSLARARLAVTGALSQLQALALAMLAESG